MTTEGGAATEKVRFFQSTRFTLFLLSVVERKIGIRQILHHKLCVIIGACHHITPSDSCRQDFREVGEIQTVFSPQPLGKSLSPEKKIREEGGGAS